MSSVFDRLVEVLNRSEITYNVLRHDPVFTSEEAAHVRGTPLASGAKALICKVDSGFVMFVLPADRKLDGRAVRRSKGWRKVRFASTEEVAALTQLAPGAIPPFGSLFGLRTLCDRQLGQNETINFNAGDHGISMSLRFSDYLLVEQPELGEFSDHPSG
jgi:Ala-tRNA(Pro) deacylase